MQRQEKLELGVVGLVCRPSDRETVRFGQVGVTLPESGFVVLRASTGRGGGCRGCGRRRNSASIGRSGLRTWRCWLACLTSASSVSARSSLTGDRMAAFPTRKLMLPRQSSVTWPPRSASMPTCSKAMSGAGEPDVGIGDSFSTTSQSAVSTKRPRRGSDPGFARNCCRASRRRPRWKAR